MNQAKAAGPKTELVGVSSRMQQSIEDMIASISEGIADCMENARTVEGPDPYNHRRSGERSDATKMMTTTAELLQSIAKLKGEFRQSYHVTRVDETTPRRRQRPAAQMDASERAAEDELRTLEDEINRAEQMMTTPPPENHGSNDDDDES